jgi:hypothetical protein
MDARRPRFRAPIAEEKIEIAPAPPTLFEVLESFTEALPSNLPPGPTLGEGLDAGKPSTRKPQGPRPKREEGVKDEVDLSMDVIGTKVRKVRDSDKDLMSEGEGKAKEAPAALVALESRVKKVISHDTTKVHQPFYVPSNRRAFKQFIIQSFRRYLLPKPSEIPDPDACAKSMAASKTEVKTFNYQAFVRDFIARPTPYRGVLVYHGLGSGKTCTSIASMEALYTAGQNKVYIFTPASLSKNYRDEITKCGPFLFRTNNYWTWISVPTFSRTPETDFLVNVLGLPPKIIRSQKGAWVPDPGKPANFDSLKLEQRKQIQEQIYAHIDFRFTFVHYNGLLEETVRDWACNTPHKFDGATIVIDEVHNLIRTINNSHMETFYKDEPRDIVEYSPKFCKVGRKYRISYLLYRMLCNSVGTKIIALSGTPIINYPQEIAILSNILCGDTRMVEATMSGIANRQQVLQKLQFHPEVDFAEVIPRPEINASVVRITPVPSGCSKVVDPATGALRGFVRDYDRVGLPEEMDRERNIDAWFSRVNKDGLFSSPKFMAVPRLPDLEKPFRELFVDTEQLRIKPRTRVPLMARLSGLLSYYKGGKADLMAKVTKDEIVELDMSDVQLKEYTGMRKEEIDKELREKKKKPAPGATAKQVGPSLYEQVTKGQNSTFKIFSRAACNFAFPADMDRPRPADFREVRAALGVSRSDLAQEKADSGEEVAEEEMGVETEQVAEEILGLGEEPGKPKEETKLTAYELALQTAIQELKAKGLEVFGKDALPTYSPKYQAMIDRMDTARGPVLVYSQFKKLEGIGLFAIALEVQKGYKKFDIQPAVGGGWTLTEETRSAGPGTPRYITYTGDEDAEKRNILKAVFNAAWGKLPSALSDEIKALTGAEHNQQGAIAKVFMITQSGAEGISLANVRQVHIMEPYWNYVRLEQVKGRAIRICSHMDLPPEERTVEVYTYISKFADAQLKARLVDETLMNFDEGQTTDQTILMLSDAKKKLTDSLFEVMQTSAVDCELNANENASLSCYRFEGEPTMESLFHPLVHVDLAEAQAAVKEI